MIVYNITIKVDWNIVDEWLIWQKEEHIPEIMATGLFDDYNMCRLLEQDDIEGPTFTVQYYTSTPERYQQYINEFAVRLRQKAFARWGDQFVAFRTIMETVH